MYGDDYEPQPRCPCCGEECDTIYIDDEGQPYACDNCVRTMSAWDWVDKHRE